MSPNYRPVIFVDANVFYSRILRDWLALMYLAEPQVIQVCWSEDVLAEVIYHLRKDHPDWDGSRITKVRDLIAGTFMHGRVKDYPHDSSWAGQDKDDAHIHAAASACGAHYLLTCDKGFSDLPQEELDRLSYEVYHPDDLFVLLDDQFPQTVRQACLKQVEYWMKKYGEANLPRALMDAQCPHFAERIRQHLLSLQDEGKLESLVP